MNIERWKPIAGYDKYEISSMGNVRNIITGRMLKPAKTRKGYMAFGLCHQCKERTHLAHRLVAIAFIDNPDNKPQVNHINGNKEDNRVENLEWITNLENTRHSFAVLGRKRDEKAGRPKRRIRCVETGAEYGSILEASRQNRLSPGNICACAKGMLKTTGGFHWEYV